MSHTPLKTGSTVLTAGTVTIQDPNILTNSTILTSNEGAGGTLGIISISISSGTTFTINSTNVLDTSTLKYVIIY